MVFAGLAAHAWAASPVARAFFEQGERAARAGDSLQAYLFYSRAAQLEPRNPTYAARKHALQNSVALIRAAEPVEPLGQPASKPADGNAAPAGPVVDPAQETVEAAQIAQGQAEELLPANPPVDLTGNGSKQSFHLRGNAQTVWGSVVSAYGIQVSFDRDYQGPTLMRFDLDDADLKSALHALETASDSFAVAVRERELLVARDTPDRRTQLTPTVAMAVPIPERISVQEAQETMTAVQQSIEIRRVSLDAAKRVVYFRDTATKARAAKQMFLELSHPRAQVEVDIEFMSVDRNSTLHYGLSLPNSSALIDFGDLPNVQLPPIPQNTGFATFGGGASLIGLGITTSTVFDTLSRSSSTLLLRSSITSVDGQPATMHIGDRYPVITSSFSGTDSQAAAAFGAASGVQFVDLGLVMKLTPTVHADSEVTLDLETAFKTLGTQVVNGIPTIANREYAGKVRLKAGEWAVIAGLVTTLDNFTLGGIAGPAQVPVAGNLFRQQQIQRQQTDTLVVLKPRLVNLPPWDRVSKPMWVGTESRPLTAF